MGNGFFTVCGIVEVDGKVLPTCAIKREFLEETGVAAKAGGALAHAIQN